MSLAATEMFIRSRYATKHTTNSTDRTRHRTAVGWLPGSGGLPVLHASSAHMIAAAIRRMRKLLRSEEAGYGELPRQVR